MKMYLHKSIGTVQFLTSVGIKNNVEHTCKYSSFLNRNPAYPM